MWSGRMGSGIVIARLPDGSWSAPSCIGTGGVGFGLQIGAVSIFLSGWFTKRQEIGNEHEADDLSLDLFFYRTCRSL